MLSDLPPLQRDFLSVSAQLSAFAAEAGVQGEISINMNMEGIIISLSDALLFEPGEAELRPESIAALHEVAHILHSTEHLVRIEGHTDNIPTNHPLYPTNWELSVARAVAIVRYLVEEEGLAPERFAAAGYAEHRPYAPNDTRENRAINRRADIVIIYPNTSRTLSLDMPLAPDSEGDASDSPTADE